MLRYLTAGESHGPALTAIVEGFPSGVTLDSALIDRELRRRQGGYGRGKRQTLETDRVIVDSGTYHGVSTGGPITLRLVNNDAKLERLKEPASPRGGHVDLAGAINYQTGIRQVLERASARETALRVAVGALAKVLLLELGIKVFGYVRELGGIAAPPLSADLAVRDASPVYTLNPEADPAIVAAIDAAKEAGDTLGGIVEAVVDRLPDRPGEPCPVGPQARRPAGDGGDEHPGDQGGGDRPGHRGRPPSRLEGDGPDRFRGRPPRRTTAGSASAGRPTTPGGSRAARPTASRSSSAPPRSRSAPWPRAAPPSTWRPRQPQPASYERSDVCAVPAASVIVENVVAFEVASAVVEKYVGTSLPAIRAAMAAIENLSRDHLKDWGAAERSGVVAEVPERT